MALVLHVASRKLAKLATELGLPAATLLFSLLFWLTGRILRTSRRARSSLVRALALGSLGGITALLVHSAADFNLYIPANGLVFSVLLGMGYAASLETSTSDRSLSSKSDGEIFRRHTIPVKNKRTFEDDDAPVVISAPVSS